LTSLYGGAICFEAQAFEKNGAWPHFLHFLDVLKKNERAQTSKGGTLGPLTGEYRASVKKVNYR